MSKILIIDDEKDNVDLIVKYGNNLGNEMVGMTDELLALKYLENEQFDLIILDVMMPKMNGYELISQIKRYSNAKIIFLSAKTNIKDRIRGLKLGAIDYMVKPFSLEELFLKISNIIEVKENYECRNGNLILNFKEKTLVKNETNINISPILFELLYELINNENKVLSRKYLLEVVWNRSIEYSSRTVDIHILKLRTLLQEDGGRIKTVRTKGYMYENKNRNS